MSNIIGSSNTQVYKTAQGQDPYQSQKSNIKKTFWDKAANFFGLRSSYGKQMQDLDLQSNLRQDQLNMLEDEAKYNSESEKVLREREAGLNPDLQGIEGASEAGEYNEPEQTPSSFNYEDSAGQVASAFKGCVDLGIALFTGFLDVRGLINEVSSKGVSRMTSIRDFAKQVVDDSLQPPAIETDESGKWQNYILGAGESYESLAQRLGDEHVRYIVPQFSIPDISFVNKKDQKRFDSFLKQYKSSITADSKRYKEYYDYLTSRKNSALASSSPFSSPSYKNLEDVFRPISKLMFDVNKLSLEYQEKANENAKRYETSYAEQNGAEGAATNDVLANLSASQLNDYNKSVNEKWNEAQKSFEKFAKDNPVLGMIGIILLNYLRSNMPMPSIDLSKKNTFINNNTNNQTNTDKVVNINN